MVPLDQFGRKHLLGRLPQVVRFRVSLPFYEVLQFTGATEVPVTPDGLDLELLLSLHKVRGRSSEVVPVLIGLLIGGEQ